MYVSGPDPGALFSGLGRLAYAWTQANTQLLFGATQVVGTLVTDANRALFRGMGLDTPGGARSERDDDFADDESAEDDDDGFEFRARSSSGGRGGGGGFRAELHSPRGARSGRAVSRGLADSVSRALRDTAEVIPIRPTGSPTPTRAMTTR